MSVSLDCLLKILQLELLEVEHDLNGLKELYTSRHDRAEITNYVFLENTALLQSELNSIHQIGLTLKKMEVDNTMTTEQLFLSIDDFVKKEIRKKQYPEAIYDFIKLKLTKVSKYIDM